MKATEINIRDPFVLAEDGTYYLYGTRGETCWMEGTGFDCYVSADLGNWEGPIEVFHKPEGFWADRNCWAPEVHRYRGSYYLFATFKSSTCHGGTAILKADSPLGPFKEYSLRQVTPLEWECIDGTFGVDQDGRPYMIFVHEWVQTTDGEICALPLTEDLKAAAGSPVLLFRGSEAPWARYRLDSKRPGYNYVTDGPFLHRSQSGQLMMIWSGFGAEGYAEAVAVSEDGRICGKWRQEETLLFSKDGGHGMIFRDFRGRLLLTLHTPNTHLEEHPVFYELKEEGGLRVSRKLEL